jgi:hypothetical protein
MKLRISQPNQQIEAMVGAREFLLRLIDTKETPRIPREVRREARAILRHYPPSKDLRPLLIKLLGKELPRIDK